jgi:hypothetical protein
LKMIIQEAAAVAAAVAAAAAVHGHAQAVRGADSVHGATEPDMSAGKSVPFAMAVQYAQLVKVQAKDPTNIQCALKRVRGPGFRVLVCKH